MQNSDALRRSRTVGWALGALVLCAGKGAAADLSTVTIEGFARDVMCVVFTPDGKSVIGISLIRENAKGYGTARFCDPSGRVSRQRRWPANSLERAAISADGSLLIATGDNLAEAPGGAYAIDVATGQSRRIGWHQNKVWGLAISPDGKTVATAGGNSAALNDPNLQRAFQELGGANGPLHALAFSPDGKTLATGGEYGSNGPDAGADIRLWDVATLTSRLRLAGHKDQVEAVVFSPDGKTLASGARDRTIRFWEAATGGLKATMTLPKAVVTDSEDETKRAKKSWVANIAFSPDGRVVAVATWGKVVSLFSVADGKEIITLTGHKGIVWSVAISPDGTRLASGSEDKTVKLWDFAQISVGLDVNALAAEVRTAPIAADKAEDLADILDNAAKAFANEKFDAGTDRLDHFRKKLSKAGLPADLSARWDAAAGRLIDRATRKK